MNAIIGFSELARQSPYTETLQLYIERIAASGKILNALVKGVLDLAGIEAGKFTLHPDNFQLHTVLHTAVKPFQFDTSDDTVSWKIAIDPTIPAQLYGDSTRLTQVLVNLISNAVKFTQRGTIAVLVTLEDPVPDFTKSFEDAQDRLWLHFSIEDTGIGILEDEQSAIFQQFFQGQEARCLNYGGTGGIGMTIVSKIVETMQGTIWFKSTPGIGTHVHVILPFSLKTQEKPERTMAASLGALRILVVEDNSSNRMMLQEWLSLLEFRVETAENGIVALKRWNKDIHQGLQRLEQAVQDGDLAALSKAAHKLKGAIGKLRSKTVQELTQHLESLKRKGDIEEAIALLKRLKKELQSILERRDTSL